MSSPPGATFCMSGSVASKRDSSILISTRCIKCLYSPITWPAGKACAALVKVSGEIFKKASTCSASKGKMGLSMVLKSLNASKQVVHTSCNRASCPANLASSHGLLASTYSLTRSANAMVSRTARAKSRDSKCCAIGASASRSSTNKALPSSDTTPNLPSKRFAMNPAERLAMLMNLPTKSALTRAIKSSALKSTSSLRPLSLAAK